MTMTDVRNTSTNALKLIIETNSGSRCVASNKGEIDGQFGRRLYIYQKLRKVRPIRDVMNARIQSNIDRLFEKSSAVLSWKHCATNFPSADDFAGLFIIFTVRHPASWLVSLFRKPHTIIGEKPGSLSEFIDFEWKTVGRERLEKRSYKPLELFQEKVKSYRAFQGKLDARDIRYAVLKFEDIVMRQEEAFRSIADRLRDPKDDFQPLIRSTKDEGKSLDDYIADYKDEKWRQEIAGLECRINEMIDWDVVGEFGYAPV